MAGHARPLEERFWAMVDQSGECWLWKGSARRDGYGVQSTTFGRPPRAVHRVSWELHYGTIPEGLCVLHRCDVKRCIRPDHLFVGTKQANTLDMIAKGRSGLKRDQKGPNNSRWKGGVSPGWQRKQPSLPG